MYLSTKNQRLETQNWFEMLRDQICSSFEKLELQVKITLSWAVFGPAHPQPGLSWG